MYKCNLKTKYTLLSKIIVLLLHAQNQFFNQPIMTKIHPLILLKNKPNQLSNTQQNTEIKILDTSKGDIIDYKKIMSELHRLKCINCGFVYEGNGMIKTCPICGSDKFDDSYDEMYF